jgi:hypothetical protein
MAYARGNHEARFTLSGRCMTASCNAFHAQRPVVTHGASQGTTCIGGAESRELPCEGRVTLRVVPKLFQPEAARAPGTSLLRLAAIQSVERKQDLADLAPQGDFITAEAVQGIVGQIGET